MSPFPQSSAGLGLTEAFLSPGLVLGGGSDSIYGILFVKDILPGTMAFEEGSLRPLDLIHYINGAPTQELTFSESIRLMELEVDDLSLKATRYGRVCLIIIEAY